MGSISYAPKHYNPNWSQYSHKRKLWEAEQKRKDKHKNSRIQKKENAQTKK